MSRSIPKMFWDIVLAEQFNTTPWDVRENITVSDYLRIQEWNKAENQGQVFQTLKSHAGV